MSSNDFEQIFSSWVFQLDTFHQREQFEVEGYCDRFHLLRQRRSLAWAQKTEPASFANTWALPLRLKTRLHRTIEVLLVLSRSRTCSLVVFQNNLRCAVWADPNTPHPPKSWVVFHSSACSTVLQFYNESEAKKYTSSSRMIAIQRELTERALELLNISTPNGLLLDIGCGSGLSGTTISENGYEWIGYGAVLKIVLWLVLYRMDISEAMLSNIVWIL